jgi:DNA-directed RNA polymerase specialized sigma24 family protein
LAGGKKMRGPAQIKPWLSEEEFLVWIREAASREAYQKRLAIWLTKIGPFHADEVAKMLGVSKQAVEKIGDEGSKTTCQVKEQRKNK